ncbi:transglutaminase domain-containing protein [Flavobacterium xinjiangense]|uniref:Transglutaminase-like domain-containing protein n=1 Tax=Flavobacterium xinjiangense TaxID=178356 RepID=A0A1M7JR56_9FLAO|nr:transglutaminase domain-containing protein [Flavobacterium xinjiangense]SHM55560.1 Transglutaminase-like domain-containing protein [Flavobacterium xinjiangense]
MKLKYLFFIFFSFAFVNAAYCQKYILVDSIVESYSKEISNVDQLVELINKDFSKQEEKARAVFKWVTTNISYDVDLAKVMNSKSMNAFSYKTEKEKEIKEKKFKLDLVMNAMASRKAVCHSYAALVEYLCEKSGIETKIILGNLKSDASEIGALPNKINHAWNVVKIDNHWRFVDATLAAGFISLKTNSFKFYFNDSYFFTTPERFFLNHYPLDENWLLTKKNKKDFAQLPLFFGSYFQNNYDLIKSESGIYSTLENGNLIFAIQGLEQYDTVEYSSSINNKIIYFDQKNDSDFTISLLDKKNSFVSIFVNGKIIAIYKII